MTELKNYVFLSYSVAKLKYILSIENIKSSRQTKTTATKTKITAPSSISSSNEES